MFLRSGKLSRPASTAPAGREGRWALTVEDDLGRAVELQVAQQVQELLDGGLPHAPPPQELSCDAHALGPLHGLDLPQLGQVCDHVGGWKVSTKKYKSQKGSPSTRGSPCWPGSVHHQTACPSLHLKFHQELGSTGSPSHSTLPGPACSHLNVNGTLGGHTRLRRKTTGQAGEGP